MYLYYGYIAVKAYEYAEYINFAARAVGQTYHGLSWVSHRLLGHEEPTPDPEGIELDDWELVGATHDTIPNLLDYI